jgi:hypothetical protein
VYLSTVFKMIIHGRGFLIPIKIRYGTPLAAKFAERERPVEIRASVVATRVTRVRVARATGRARYHVVFDDNLPKNFAIGVNCP